MKRHVGAADEVTHRLDAPQQTLPVPTEPALGGDHVVDDALRGLRRHGGGETPADLDADHAPVNGDENQDAVVVAVLSDPYVIKVRFGEAFDVVNVWDDQRRDLDACLPLHRFDELTQAHPLRRARGPVRATADHRHPSGPVRGTSSYQPPEAPPPPDCPPPNPPKPPPPNPPLPHPPPPIHMGPTGIIPAVRCFSRYPQWGQTQSW